MRDDDIKSDRRLDPALQHQSKSLRSPLSRDIGALGQMAHQSDDIWIVVAAYNEGRVIGPVIRELRRQYSRIVVVDDCSGDDTGSSARDAGAIVLRHVVNLGQGASLQTGLDFCLLKGARYIVTFDADGQHDPADIPALLNALESQKVDIACGSRFLGKVERLPPMRRIMLRGAAVFTYLSTGLRVTDAHNGLRAMTSLAARTIRLRQNRMAHASEIMHQIAANSIKWTEVPVTIRYTDYSLAKGQRAGNAINILIDLLVGKLHK
jgi:polyprenyl-phospho-N-acetylgalactosaminyl synthase